MSNRKKIIAVILFLLLGTTIFTFANPGNNNDQKDDDTEQIDDDIIDDDDTDDDTTDDDATDDDDTPEDGTVAPIINPAQPTIDNTAILLAQQLQNAKTAAILALNNYARQADYTPENWALVQAAIARGIAAINGSTTVGGVNRALAAAKAAIDAIKTIAEQLADAKVAAILSLNNYAKQADYTPENWALVQAEITKGIAAINAATTIPLVNTALANAKGAIDAIKTIAEQLQDAKTAAILALNNYADEADYTPENWALVEAEITKGIAAINAATTIPLVNTALANAKTAIDAILTIDQLQNAKNAAIAELNNYADEDNYKPKKWDLVEIEIAKGITAINAATTIAEVDEALADAKLAIDAIKSKSQTLQDAKDAAILELNNYADEDDYTPANWALVQAEITKGIAAINAATNPAKVAKALINAKNAIDAIETIAEQLQEAKDAAILELNGYAKKGDYTKPNWILVKAEITKGIAAINAATTIPEVQEALANAKLAIDAIPVKPKALKDAKDAAKLELENYADPDDYTPENWLLVQLEIDKGKAAIDAAGTIEEVNCALYTAKIAIDAIPKIEICLDEVKANAILELQNYADEDDYTPENWALVQARILAGITAINAATTAPGVESALAAAKAAIDLIETETEGLVSYKLAAIANLRGYAIEADYKKPKWDEVVDAMNAGELAINAATTKAEVDSALAAAKAIIDDIPVIKAKLDSYKITKKAELEAYEDEDNYSDEYWDDVLDIITDGKDDIDDADTIGKVNKALLDAKKAIDLIPVVM